MFRPRESHSTRLKSFLLRISPSYRLRWMRDSYENNVGLLDLTENASELVIESECLLEVDEENPFDFIISPEAAEYPFAYGHDLGLELHPLTSILYPRDAHRVGTWLEPLWHPGKRVGTLELLQDLNRLIYRDVKYQRRERRGVQSPAETLERNSGSCRDFAALFMEACRFLGLAARFVSGYMYSNEITGRMSMHGWAEIYLPGAGWRGFDPSWGILAASQYIPVAVTLHPEHAPPISGCYFGAPRDFMGTDVELYVKKLDDAPMPEAAFASAEDRP
jgi:transglutaminase-like putative cysteine protease